MQVAQYTYQSPSPSAIQVGKLDPSSVKDESTKSSAELPKATNETLNKAQSFQATQVQEVKPTVSATSIDTYA
jgi:hypothetical protein